MGSWKRIVAAALAGAMGMSMVVLTSRALADQDALTDDVPRLLPYRGRLERDGAGVSGSVEMAFSLTSSTSATVVWTEAQTVTVVGGDFSVLLGSVSAASAEALDALLDGSHDLYLSVSVVVDGETLPLSGNQRLLPVPMAVWTTRSTDFYVHGTTIFEGEPVGSESGVAVEITTDEGTLQLDGSTISASGDLNLLTQSGSQLSIGGDTTVDGTLTLADGELNLGTGSSAALGLSGGYFRFNVTESFSSVRFGGDVGVSSTVTVDETLTVDGTTTVGGSLSAASLDVAGTLSVTGDLDVPGTLLMGYEVVWCDSSSCFCPSEKIIIAGGAWCSGTSPLTYSVALSANGWFASCGSGDLGGIKMACVYAREN